jgi:hypothetical protein
MSTSLQPPPQRTPPRPTIPRAAAIGAAVLAAAAVAGALTTVLGDRGSAQPAAAAPSTGASSVAPAAPAAPAAPPAAAAATGGASSPPNAPAASGQLLWPFADEASAAAWQRAYRDGGHQPWHLDPAGTALGFAAHLGYAGIDRTVRSTVDGRNAYVAVGFRTPDGSIHTAADVHLVRIGSGTDAPWEVVGTRDGTLTVDRPAYGTTVTSPLTVGGRITGVDERVAVTLHAAGSEASLGAAAVAAGGQRAPWSVRVSFRAERGTVLTVAAATGGHLAPVERFAVTGVRVGVPRPAAGNDVDGDGRSDAVSVPAPGMLRVRYATGATDTVTFAADPGDGRLTGVVDADADGRAEVFVHVGAGASVDLTSVFRYVNGRLRAVTLDGDQLRLVSGASLTHGDSWACRPPAAPIVQWSGTSRDGIAYPGTVASYRFSGATLVRVSSRPLTVDERTPGPSGCGEMRT